MIKGMIFLYACRIIGLYIDLHGSKIKKVRFKTFRLYTKELFSSKTLGFYEREMKSS